MLSNTAFASNVATSGDVSHTKIIAKAFNDFRYKMTVDVNPNDSQYQAKAIADFKGRMAQLQSKGISSEEVMAYMRASVLDSNTRADFDRMLTSINVDRISSEEAGNLAMRFMAAKYQQGASYSGGGKANYKIALVIIGVVIVGVVTYLVIKHCKDQKAKTVTDTVTKTSTETLTATEVQTNTETVTNVNTVTQTSVVTNVEVINNTETVTHTDTLVTTNTVTNVETVTNVQTVTNTFVYTQTDTVTNTLTNTVTATQTNTVTDTHTNTGTGTGTGTCSNTDTETETHSNTDTETETHTNTGTNTSYGYCCNDNTGNTVPASPTGCANGSALYFVLTIEQCIADHTQGHHGN